MENNMIAVVGTIVEQLSPLSSEDRQRVLQAALALLGEKSINTGPKLRSQHAIAEAPADDPAFPPRARTWIRQNQVSADMIENLFHKGDSGLEIIASEIPGKTNREKVQNAYVLIGLARFLETGEGKFDDKSARSLCERHGFFDGTNHMKYMKTSEFAGARDKGWTLTAPGLKRGVALIRELGQVAT